MSANTEDIASFRTRARAWLAANVRRTAPGEEHHETAEGRAHQHEVQAQLFDAGFAGIAFPAEYGGAGLTLEHQKAFAEESEDYDVPTQFMVSIGMLAPTLLEHGSDTLKQRHLPRMLRGEETWIQLLSEPSGGSDMAGVMTWATRDGDTWVINGAKMWSTGAHIADYGMCLTRTDWDVPKHRGLSMIAVPLHAPGVTIDPIIGINRGPVHFCQEFLDDVVVPADSVIGAENQGWSVAQSLLFYERNATAGVGFGLGLGGGGEGGGESFGGSFEHLFRTAQASGALANGAIRQQLAEAFIDLTVSEQVGVRVNTGMRTGALKGQWGSLLKLGLGIDSPRRGEIGLAVSACDGVIWTGDDEDGGGPGKAWLNSRSIAIAGGTNEMQRNIISERLLGLPREPAFDRDLPFSEVLKRRSSAAGPGAA